MNKSKRIAITGIGPLSSGGSGCAEVLRAVREKRTGLSLKDYTVGKESVGKFHTHEVRNFDIRLYPVDKGALNEMDSWKMGDKVKDLYYFLAVISLGLLDAGLRIDAKNGSLTGLVLAHENPGLDHFYQKLVDEMSFAEGAERPATRKAFFETLYKKFHRTGYDLQTFMPLHHIAKAFGIHGYTLFLNNACASGLYALEAASDMIKSEKAKQVIVASVDSPSVFKQIWFNDIGMLAADGKIKPFAKNRDGFALGEGGAALVMESMDSALKRNASIYAEYMGGAFAQEGWKVAFPDISGDYYKNVIRGAISRSGLKTSDIDLIVPHGIGAKITDSYESKAMLEVFGKNRKKPVVTALKPYIGHALGSSTLLETAIMLAGLKNNFLPETLNCDILDKTLNIEVLKEERNAEGIKIALKTACGFAGFDAACIFKKVEKH